MYTETSRAESIQGKRVQKSVFAFVASLSAVSGALALDAVTLAQGRGGATAAGNPPAVTFSEHIAPIVFAHCSTCHRPGGGAPFNLLTYADIRPRAAAIANATSRRLMPPWKPVAGYGEFVGERRLTSEQIELIKQWVEQGAPEGGDLDRSAQLPEIKEWRLGEPDLVLQMPDFLLEPRQSDLYRNFAIAIPLKNKQYVRGVDFRPDDPEFVHHGGMRIDCTGRSRLLDERDPLPGYDGVSLDSAMNPEGYFLGWTPGQAAPLAPPDLSWSLEAGCDLVLELHFPPVQARTLAKARVGIYFSESPPTQTPSLIRLGREDMDIPAGSSDYTIRDSYLLPVDVEVHTVQPHAHNVAKVIRVFATLPDGSTRWLLYIDDWDFDWQDVYRYAQPFWLPKGSTLAMEFTYDNSAANRQNPHQPPARIHFGQRTSDEMGFLWLQVVTRTPGDRALLDRETWEKSVRQDISGLETMTARSPSDARLHADLAYFHLQIGNRQAAEARWRDSIRVNPSFAPGHYDLGTLLMNRGELDEALVHLREAARLEPQHSEAHNNIGSVLVRLARQPEAIVHFREAIEAMPANAEAHYNLARQLEERGDLGEAVEHYQQAVALQLDESDVLFTARLQASIGMLLGRQRRFAEALGHYEEALKQDPNLVSALLDLSWILATAPEGTTAAPGRAVELAERANRVTTERDRYQDPLILETLAVAYAADNRLDNAIETAEVALTMAESGARSDLANRLRAWLKSWRRARELFR
jgi:tetratricopeptide (TPR) repeat protein/mono/diheme cytochrome c family protein